MKICSKKMLLAFVATVILFNDAGAMFRRIIFTHKNRRCIFIAGVGGTIAYNHYKHRKSRKNKRYGTLDYNKWKIKPLPTMFDFDNSQYSNTVQHINDFSAWAYGEDHNNDDNSEENLRQKINKILSDYYKDGFYQLSMKEDLVDTTLFFIQQEQKNAKHSYAFYHGTYCIMTFIFMTMLHEAVTKQSFDRSLVLRQPGSVDYLKKIDNTIQYAQDAANEYARIRNSHLDAIPEDMRRTIQAMQRMPSLERVAAQFYDDAFLSVNTSVMGNTYPPSVRGSNSLHFITPIHSYNDTISTILPWWNKNYDDNEINNAQFHIIKSMFQAYLPNIDIERYRELIEELSKPVNGLIQIIIPKEKCTRSFIATSFNMSRGNKYVTDEDQYGSNIDNQNGDGGRHVCVPLDPDLFENSSSGVQMNVVVWTDPEVFEHRMKMMEDFIKEVTDNKE